MCGESEARSVDTDTRAHSITVRSHAASLLPPSVLVFGDRPTIAFHRVRLPGNHEKNVSQGMLPTSIGLVTTHVRNKAPEPPFVHRGESGVPMFSQRPKWFRHCIFRDSESKDSGLCAAVSVSHLQSRMCPASEISDSVCTSLWSQMSWHNSGEVSDQPCGVVARCSTPYCSLPPGVLFVMGVVVFGDLVVPASYFIMVKSRCKFSA